MTGIEIISHPRLTALTGVSEWKYSGDLSLLDKPAGAILLSRQSRRPKPNDWWINATVETIKTLAQNDYAILCGGGILHLDFVRWAAKKHAKAIYLDMPRASSGKNRQDVPDWSDLRLEPVIESRRNKTENMVERDKWTAALADKIVAVAVRAGGNMETIGRWAIEAGKEVAAIVPPDSSKGAKGNLNLIEAGANPITLSIVSAKEENISSSAEIVKTDIPDLRDYLWHFTRECAGPWHDQTWDDYFSDLAASAPWAAHDAIDTLEHILKTGAVKARGGLVRGGYEVVCFSSKTPSEIASNPVYRKWLARWDFKPYAIGVRKETAKKLGAKQVRYGNENDYRKLPENEKYLFQLATGKAEDWTREAEWRIAEDVSLNKLSPSDVIVLVESSSDILRIQKATGFPVICFDLI